MLTPRQRDALEFLRSHQQRTGTGATFAQVAQALGLKSKSGVHRLVEGLEERGLITRLRRRSCAIRVVDLNPLAEFSTEELTAELRRRSLGDAGAHLGRSPCSNAS